MNILFDLVKFPEYGGISTVTSLIIPKLIEKGYDISIISHRMPNKNYEGPVEVNLYYMPDPNNLNSKQNWEYYEELLTKQKFDLLIYQDSYAPIEQMVCSLSKRYQIKLLVFEHNSPCLAKNSKTLRPWYSIKGLIRRCLNVYFISKEIVRKRYLYDMSEKYILLCASYVEEFKKYTRIADRENKLLYINNPTIINSTDIVTRSDSTLFVGRLMREKGIEGLIDIANTTKLIKYPFYIVGDGELRGALEEVIKSKKALNVHLEGFRDPRRYYAACKVFWMNSKFEGWPMTLIEAMSYGCVPVVMNTFTAVNDIIDDGINGFIIDKNDMNMFVDKTHSLLTDKVLFSMMSKNAIEKTHEFSIEKIMPKWLELINNQEY